MIIGHLIYVVDDDRNLLNLLRSHLVNEKYSVEIFEDGQSLIDRFSDVQCDMIITDIMMPGMSGYDLCREIRKKSDVPIIMLSAKDEEFDRVLGLELGSDDYISKPFSLREVTVKARNMLRRRENMTLEALDGIVFCKDIKINRENRTIKIKDAFFKATVLEYKLLELLVMNKNMAFSREKIIEKIWGYEHIGDTRQVDYLVKRLRKKLLLADADCNIETIWGFGYKVSE